MMNEALIKAFTAVTQKKIHWNIWFNVIINEISLFHLPTS